MTVDEDPPGCFNQKKPRSPERGLFS